MSIETTVANVARRWLDSAVAYAREFLLVSAYVAVCVAITAPTIIVTGGTIYWVSTQIPLEGLAYTVYFGAGALAIMLVFAMLHRVVQAIGRAMLGGTRDPYWQV